MSNRSPKRRLLIDVIDYSSMTHLLLTDYYNARKRDCFLVIFFSFVILLAVLDENFPCISVTMSRCKVLITNRDDS